MATSDDEEILNAQHAGRDMEAAIIMGLHAAGKDNDQLTPNDLAAIGQFHLRAKEATLELVHLVGLKAGL